jgi:peptidylprolyl isomerase
VIAGFMAQGGDPMGTGEGGSKLPDVPAEFSDLPHVRGIASMARAEAPDSANSQFFIMLAPRFVLDHKYSAFGRVIEGMANVDAIAVGEPPADPTKIVRATIGGPLPAPPVVAAVPVTASAPETAPPAAPAAEQAAPQPTVPEQPAPAPAEVTPPAPAPEGPPEEAPTPQ